MRLQTAKILIRETSAFYGSFAESFSDTRKSAWEGWLELTGIIEDIQPSFDVLDLACGNMRFEAFLNDKFPDRSIRAYGVDNCPDLANMAPNGSADVFVEMDIMGELEREGLSNALQNVSPKCMLAVSFGFMHHIPLPEWRRAFLQALIGQTAPMGYAIASFWQPHNSPRLLEKARETTTRGCKRLGIELSEEDGDYLFGWKDESEAFRYVHDYTDSEISDLVDCACDMGCRLYKTYSADGKTGDLNRYVVFKRDIY